MKATTEVYASFESKGRPRYNKKMHGTTQQVLQQLITWTLSVEMGHRIVITIARTEEELMMTRTKDATISDLESELEGLIADISED